MDVHAAGAAVRRDLAEDLHHPAVAVVVGDLQRSPPHGTMPLATITSSAASADSAACRRDASTCARVSARSVSRRRADLHLVAEQLTVEVVVGHCRFAPGPVLAELLEHLRGARAELAGLGVDEQQLLLDTQRAHHGPRWCPRAASAHAAAQALRPASQRKSGSQARRWQRVRQRGGEVGQPACSRGRPRRTGPPHTTPARRARSARPRSPAAWPPAGCTASGCGAARRARDRRARCAFVRVSDDQAASRTRLLHQGAEQPRHLRVGRRRARVGVLADEPVDPLALAAQVGGSGTSSTSARHGRRPVRVGVEQGGQFVA